jgi:hypothetical protein
LLYYAPTGGNGAHEENGMKASKKKPVAKKAKLDDLAPKADPKGGLTGFTGGVTVAAGDVNGDTSLPAVQSVFYKVRS